MSDNVSRLANRRIPGLCQPDDLRDHRTLNKLDHARAGVLPSGRRPRRRPTFHGTSARPTCISNLWAYQRPTVGPSELLGPRAGCSEATEGIGVGYPDVIGSAAAAGPSDCSDHFRRALKRASSPRWINNFPWISSTPTR